MSIFSAEKLYKTYGDKILLNHISFSFAEKQRVGLIGVNGTGKTTLLNVIAKLDSVEEGAFQHAKDFTLEYLAQKPLLDEALTVLEHIYFGDSDTMVALREYEQALLELERDPENEDKVKRLLKKQQKMDQFDAWEANTQAKTILTKLGITDFEKKIQELSGGQKKRVALAKALISPADLLLLDEPTNHLDHETIEWLEGYLSQYPGALLLVTHDRYFLNRVTNHIFELDHGDLYVYEGNYEVFLEKKAEREDREAASESKRQNLLRRELAWLKRGAKARTTKQKARIQRAEQLQEQKGKEINDPVEMNIGSARLGKKVLELKEIGVSFAGKPLFTPFSYLVTPKQRLGIVGPNGSGKTTLLNIMAGRIETDEGQLDVGETVKIGYYTQENVEMDESLRVIEYVREVAEVIHTADGVAVSAEQMLERFLFPRPSQWNYIQRLSGGEKRRLYLLQVLMQQPNVLFLDEPTNDLDIQTLSVLEDYLEQFSGVVITVSHDRYFLDRVVDELITFEKDTHGQNSLHSFMGSYSEYLEASKERKELLEADRRELKKQTQKVEYEQAPPVKLKLSFKEQKEWDQIESVITELEQRLEQLEQEIIQAGSDSMKVNELYEEQTKVTEELEQAMERWTELSMLIEEIEKRKTR
ncbi:ABC-F family ATP-binding cassette domain-containing protein [Bacillus horti]|uniref:ATP-binding cassette subfamily F protein uup n=1 Tax=Caldalkalibacillus horti TaxID=77523 RepID=A0ABT9W320_9BACI|nr:ABC-F family ATP-binding cassette domain-containing protein [Bacillus horti]MDQ0167648.1 ATP-binding cassette subfamily F protein uup [Bacillus horti]